MEDMTDKAIDWIGHRSLWRPISPSSSTSPRSYPRPPPRAQGGADRYRGKFDQGWDRLREETLARQKKLGVVPQDCRADGAPTRSRPGTRCRRPSSLCCAGRWRSTRASWSTPITTWAGMFEALEKLGIFDDTLIYYIIGDNGASAEGTLNGCFNEMSYFNGCSRSRRPST